MELLLESVHMFLSCTVKHWCPLSKLKVVDPIPLGLSSLSHQ